MLRRRWSALAGMLLYSRALAGEAFDAEVTYFAQIAPVPGGLTTTVHVLALDADGRAREGLGATPLAAGGTASGWVERGQGWYSFEVTPQLEARAVSVRLRGGVSGRVVVPVIPSRPALLDVSVEPGAIVAGGGQQARVTAAPPPFSGIDDVQLSTTSGTLGPASATEDGAIAAVLTSPAVNFPHVGVLGASAPGGVAIGAAFVGFRGAVDFPVAGPPGAQVELVIGDARFGPVTLDEGGRGAVPIEVPPGVRFATQRTRDASRWTEGALDLATPAARTLAWLPASDPLAPGVESLLFVAVATPEGAPDPAARLIVDAQGGAVGALAMVRPGLYVVPYTPADVSAGTVRVRRVGAELDVDELAVTHLPPMPPEGLPPVSDGAVAAVVLLPDAVQAAPDGSVGVDALAVDRFGRPIADVPLRVELEGPGRIEGDLTTAADGRASARWTGDGTRGRVRLVVSAPGGVDGHADLLLTSAPLTVSYPPEPAPLADLRLRVGQAAVEVPPTDAFVPLPVADGELPAPLPLPSTRPERLGHLRLSGIAGGLRYTQRGDTGPLLAGETTLLSPSGGPSDAVLGGRVDALLWAAPWLGLRAGGRVEGHRFRADGLPLGFTDLLLQGRAHLLVRAPVRLTDDVRLSLGGHAGGAVDDLLVLRGCLESGCTLTHDSVLVPSADVGADLGLDAAGWFAHASFTQGLAGATEPYRVAGEAHLGLWLDDRVGVSLGASAIRRRAALVDPDGVPLGTLEDSRWAAEIGLLVGF